MCRAAEFMRMSMDGNENYFRRIAENEAMGKLCL